MWNDRRIEQLTKRKLTEDLGDERGNERFGLYTSAREALVGEILPQIRAVQPDLTDHGPEHVANVLDNVAALLGLGNDLQLSDKELSGTELYALILSILFHDTGNIFDRQEHQRHVATVYDYVRSEAHRKRFKQERRLVLKVAEAHCGFALDGSKDTLKHVGDTASLYGEPIRLRQIASILRFADELAEGPQRTSFFMQEHHHYPPGSDIYHAYADITDVFIDRGNERIALTYDIELDVGRSSSITRKCQQELRKLLKFTYQRIIKLNQERKYARHYSDLLAPFKKTSITFNFIIKEQPPCFLELPPITDVVVPGEKEKQLQEYHDDYKFNNIIGKIREHLRMGVSK